MLIVYLFAPEHLEGTDARNEDTIIHIGNDPLHERHRLHFVWRFHHHGAGAQDLIRKPDPVARRPANGSKQFEIR